MVLEKVYDELISLIEDLRKQISGGTGGTTDYSDLDNKPSINGITLSGYKYSDDLKIAKSMTETQYTTAQKYTQTLFCLTENEPESHTQETVPASNFEWTVDGDNWVSDAYLVHEENATSITVTTTTEGITLSVTGSGEDRTVILTSSVDPTTLTDIVIQIDTVNDVGSTRIMKNGVEFGKPSIFKEIYTGDTYSASVELSDSIQNYDILMIVEKYSGQTPGDHRISGFIPVPLASIEFTVSGHGWYVEQKATDNTHLSVITRLDGFISNVYGIKF